MIPEAIRSLLGDDLLSEVDLEFDLKTWTWTARFDTSLRTADIDRLFECMPLRCGGPVVGRALLNATGLQYKVSNWSATRKRKATSEEYYWLQRRFRELRKIAKTLRP
jgi:hypothetical protein